MNKGQLIEEVAAQLGATRAAAERATMAVIRLLFRVSGGIRVEGLEHVPAAGPVIFAPNHGSYADPPALGAVLPRRCWYMAKELILGIPVFGAWCRSLLAYPVRVGGAVDREAVRLTEALLAAGEAVCIFPEGRVGEGRLQEMQPGVALIALRTGTPIVPVGLIGVHRMFPPPWSLPRFLRGGVTVRFGPPIQPAAAAGGGRRGQVEALSGRLRDALAALLSEPPAAG